MKTLYYARISRKNVQLKNIPQLWQFKCIFKTCNMMRYVKCGHVNGTKMPDSACSELEKPDTIKECSNRLDCMRYERYLTGSAGSSTASDRLSSAGVIVYSNWSKCSVKCNTGYRTREAECRSAHDQSIRLPMSVCGHDQVDKLLRIKCNLAK